MINKSIIIIGIIFYISVIFITSSLLQHNHLFKNDPIFSLTNNIQLVYAADDDGGDDNKGDDDDGGGDNKGDSGDDVTDTSNFRSANDEANDNEDEDKKSSNGRDDVTEASNPDDSNDDSTNDRSDNSKFIADISDEQISTSDESTDDGNLIPGESEDDGTNPPGSGDGTNPPGSGDGTNPPVGIPVPVTQTSSKDSDDDNDDENDFKKKVKNEYNVNTNKISKNKVIVRDHDNNEKEIVIISNKNTCPTQSNTVELKGKIGPHGIRLLADFDPCKISDGSVTFNIPNTKNIKLAAIYIDKKNTDHAGTLVDPMKIQNINKFQGLYTTELDNKMKGTSPVTGKDTTLTKINALALYNNGDRPIQFKAGNTAALTATFIK